jgi:CBS domain containing-hemolysin-like protein
MEILITFAIMISALIFEGFFSGTEIGVVNGRIKLRTLKDRLGIKIRKGEFATLAGYLLEKAHEVPAQCTVIEAHGIAYKILKRTDHLIQEIGISRKQ